MENNIPSKQSEFVIPKKFLLVFIKNKFYYGCSKRKIPSVIFRIFTCLVSIEYRFCTCYESNKKFTESFIEFRDGPPPSERYIQEKELFHFFIDGYSTLDCFAYALYMVASTIKPTLFPIESSKLKHVYFTNICDKFNLIKSDLQHE